MFPSFWLCIYVNIRKIATWLNSCSSSVIILRTQPRLPIANTTPLSIQSDTTTACQRTTMRTPNEGRKQPMTEFLIPDFAPIDDFVSQGFPLYLDSSLSVALYPKHAIFVPTRETHKVCATELESDENRLEQNGKPNDEGCRISPHDYIQKTPDPKSN